MGSALFLASFAAVMGPMAYVQHLLSGPRLPFTAAYFGSIAMTFYFSLGVSHISSSLIPLCGECAGLRLLCFTGSDRLTRDFLLDPTATVDFPHFTRGSYPDGLPHMVPRQLLSHGLERPPDRHLFRCQEGSCLDDWLS